MNATLTANEVHQRGLELSVTLDELAKRREWTAGEGIAVATIAYCELVARHAGRLQAIAFLRDQADALEASEIRRGTIERERRTPKPDLS